MRLKFRELKFSLFILLSIILLSFSITHLQAREAIKSTGTVYSMEFLSAEYLDVDADGNEDDTRFYVYLYFDPLYIDGKSIKLYCYFEIITPSGLVYDYSGFIILYSITCTICFDVYNTVTESGWYTINFWSSFQDKGIVYSSFCTTIFDPPTGSGTGGAPIIDF